MIVAKDETTGIIIIIARKRVSAAEQHAAARLAQRAIVMASSWCLHGLPPLPHSLFWRRCWRLMSSVLLILLGFCATPLVLLSNLESISLLEMNHIRYLAKRTLSISTPFIQTQNILLKVKVVCRPAGKEKKTKERRQQKWKSFDATVKRAIDRSGGSGGSTQKSLVSPVAAVFHRPRIVHHPIFRRPAPPTARSRYGPR